MEMLVNYNPSSHMLVGEREFKLTLKPTAFFINTRPRGGSSTSVRLSRRSRKRPSREPAWMCSGMSPGHRAYPRP